MNAFWGMDTAQMREHAGRLRAASDEVEQLTSRLSSTVHAAPWEGADAESFRDGWTGSASEQLRALCADLRALGERASGEAAEQEAVSEPDDAGAPDGAAGPGGNRGIRGIGGNGLPAADLTGLVSDGIGWGFDSGIDLLEDGLGRFGVNTAGISQFQRDADHLGGILEDWATGERVPTIAELGAAGLLTIGSAGVGIYEAVTGQDTALLDDRPGGVVGAVRTDSSPAQSPQTLQDLIVQNDALRLDNPGGMLDAGQIGIQEIRSSDGGEPVYIVQVPPTEGAPISDAPGAYGEQGNSRDWGSNLRLIAGQDAAALDDVRAAMEAAGVPPGSKVMIVGHSQGGIVATQLAADPGFNSASGADGTYDVTHAFSVGAPVQTVIPAQDSTQSVNVSHEGGLGPEGLRGDLIPGLDLGGAQVDGGTLDAPNRHEVSLPGYPVDSPHPVDVLESNHDSVGLDGGRDGGYAGSVGRATSTDPTLSSLQEELTGTYLGEGTYVAESHVVTVGRGDP